MLVSCGGGGSDKGNVTASSHGTVNTSSLANIVSSSGVSSTTSVAVVSTSSNKSSSQSSNQSSNKDPALVDASNQFTPAVNERFYVYQNPAEQGVLHYLPKMLALTGMPGIASAQRTNKVSDLLKLFLDLSDSDWASSNQVTFSSRYTLDVDLQQLRQESEAAGYAQLTDIKVRPPLMSFEQRYTTPVPTMRIQIQCKNLTLLVDGNEVTLHDCNLVDTGGIIATQSINNIGGFKFEQLNFNPDAISGNSSLRGTLNIDYTLPGTLEFDRLLSADSGDLQHTWQLYFNWPEANTSTSSATATINWKTLLLDFKAQVSAGTTQWDENSMNTFVSSEMSAGAIALPTIAAPTPALKAVITRYIKQELFVAIYSEGGSSALMWAPKLRSRNVDQPDTQQIAFRYFESDLPLISRIDLSCLTKPDGQNNIYKSSSCGSNSIP